MDIDRYGLNRKLRLKINRNPIAQNNNYNKNFISSKKVKQAKLLNTHLIKQSNDEKFQRKKNVELITKRKDDTNWKPCLKLNNEYFNKMNEINRKIKRGLKKIEYKNFNRNPILQNDEKLKTIKRKKEYVPTNIYKSLNNKKIFELKIQNDNLKKRYESINFSRNHFKRTKVSNLVETNCLSLSNGFRTKKLINDQKLAHKDYDIKKPNNFSSSLNQYKNIKFRNLYNKKKNDFTKVNYFAQTLRN